MKRLLTLLIVVATLAGGALAQGKLDMFDVHVASLRVLEGRDVQKEIGITPVQRNQMDKFAEAYNADLKAYVAQLKKSGKDPAKLQGPDSKMLQLLATLKRNVMGVLTAAQLKRLREISLQVFGLNGLLDDTVAKRVGLSDDQIKRMRTEYESGSKRANAMIEQAVLPVNNQFKNAKPKTDADKRATLTSYETKRKAALDKVMPTVQKIRKETRDKILGMITKQQKDTFVGLQGKPFHSGA